MSGTLCGYVVRGPRSIADATITVLEGPGPYPDLAPVTDSDGWFCLDNLRSGRWRLRAHAPDASTAEATTQVWDGSLSEVTFNLTPGPMPVPVPVPEPEPEREPEPAGRVDSLSGGVIGLVTDTTTGEPVPGARVIVTDGPGPLPDTMVTTDSDGIFRMTGLAAGDWALHVDHHHAGETDLVVGVIAGRPVDVTVLLLPPAPRAPRSELRPFG